MTTIVIFEDNDLLRKSMQLLLLTQPEYNIIGSFDNANMAAEEIGLLQPRLVIMDIDMPGRKGTDAVRIIKESYPSVLILMHTVFEDDEKLFASLCAGANGYILKKTSPEKFLQYIEETLEGGAPFSPIIAQKVLQAFQSQQGQKQSYNLSAREHQVLTLLVKGNTYKLIAAELKISLDTVRKHVGQVYNKLHVSCGTEAVALAIRQHIV